MNFVIMKLIITNLLFLSPTQDGGGGGGGCLHPSSLTLSPLRSPADSYFAVPLSLPYPSASCLMFGDIINC